MVLVPREGLYRDLVVKSGGMLFLMLFDEPRVAVIMSVTGSDDANHLKLALTSIKQQDYALVKLFVYCDGALGADVGRVLKEFLEDGTSGDVVIHGDIQMGLAFGLNRLINSVLRYPDIEFIARMDADDFSMRHRISTQVAFLLSNPTLAVVGSWCIESQDMIKPNFYKKLPCDFHCLREFSLMRSPLVHPSVMFRRYVFEDGFRYDDDLKVMQDYDLWTRLILEGYELANIPEYLLWFRISDGFFGRRAGFKRAIREILMRVRYGRASRLFKARHALLYIGLFILRTGPSSLKRFCYARLR